MKKLLIILGLLVAAYIVAGICAWRILPAKIAEAENKRVGVTLALSKIANDQLAVSQRVSEITSQTLGHGRDKTEQVSMLLGDPTLNRMALTYMGADWSVTRSSFVGNAKHMRDLLKMQKTERKKYSNRLNEKIKELEARKADLLQKQKHPKTPANAHVNEQWRLQLEDVDRQLKMYRSSNTYREYLEKDKTAENEVAAKAKNEDAIFKMANDCEAQTVGRLVQIMAEKAAVLKDEEAEPERLKHQMSFFNIWPLNLLSKMPLGE